MINYSFVSAFKVKQVGEDADNLSPIIKQVMAMLVLLKTNSMVILKISTDTDKEREVEIVDEKGTWQSGDYLIFSSAFLHQEDNNPPEPHDINSSKFLGEIKINKEKRTWNYKGDKLNGEEQQEIASFIMDYSAPDGVY